MATLKKAATTSAIGSSTSEKLGKGNFIVGSIDLTSGDVSVSAKPTQHKTQVAASTEAERLASMNSQKRFVVLRVVGSVVAKGVTWD